MFHCTEQQLATCPTFSTTHHSNLTAPEPELRYKPNIIIKPADKWSVVVIWDRLNYLREGYRQLSDAKFYRKLDNNPMQSFDGVVANTVEDMFQNGEIDQSVTDILLELVCRTPELDMLPNIHKKDHPVEGRPIIPANYGLTERISQFVDNFVNPLLPPPSPPTT